MKKYDYVLVGSGLFAGVWAYLAGKKGAAMIRNMLLLELQGHREHIFTEAGGSGF